MGNNSWLIWKNISNKEEIIPRYKIEDKDPDNWKQGEEHDLEIKRTYPITLDGSILLDITCEGGDVTDGSQLEDDGSAEWKGDITVLPTEDRIEIKIKANDKEVELEENFIQEDIIIIPEYYFSDPQLVKPKVGEIYTIYLIRENIINSTYKLNLNIKGGKFNNEINSIIDNGENSFNKAIEFIPESNSVTITVTEENNIIKPIIFTLNEVETLTTLNLIFSRNLDWVEIENKKYYESTQVTVPYVSSLPYKYQVNEHYTGNGIKSATIDTINYFEIDFQFDVFHDNISRYTSELCVCVPINSAKEIILDYIDMYDEEHKSYKMYKSTLEFYDEYYCGDIGEGTELTYTIIPNEGYQLEKLTDTITINNNTTIKINSIIEEKIVPNYEIEDTNENDWYMEMEHKIIIKRINPIKLDKSITLNITSDSANINNKNIVDDGSENWQQEISLTPLTTNKVIINVNSDEEILCSSFIKNGNINELGELILSIEENAQYVKVNGNTYYPPKTETFKGPIMSEIHFTWLPSRNYCYNPKEIDRYSTISNGYESTFEWGYDEPLE